MESYYNCSTLYVSNFEKILFKILYFFFFVVRFGNNSVCFSNMKLK